MMRRFLSTLAFGACLGMPAVAEGENAAGSESVRILYFTADWCPNCQLIEPRLEEALETLASDKVRRVDVDVTAMQTTDQMAQANIYADAIRTLQESKAEYLWDYYGGFTGVAVLVAADTGEPLSCFTSAVDVDTMLKRLRADTARVAALPPGSRWDGETVPPHCP